MKDDILEIVLDRDTIEAKVKEIAKEISEDYKGKNPLFVCVLKGAVVFLSDLIKEVDIPAQIDFMDVSSYGESTTSSGIVRIVKDLECELAGRHVLIVEDIIDSGLTLSYLIDLLKRRECASLEIVALLDKVSRRKVEIPIKYRGFEVEDNFLVGYGLDYAEKYRNTPFVFIPKPEVYQS